MLSTGIEASLAQECRVRLFLIAQYSKGPDCSSHSRSSGTLCPCALRMPAHHFREGVHHPSVKLLACSCQNLLFGLMRRQSLAVSAADRFLVGIGYGKNVGFHGHINRSRALFKKICCATMIGITERNEFPTACARASVLRCLRKLATASSRLISAAL